MSKTLAALSAAALWCAALVSPAVFPARADARDARASYAIPDGDVAAFVAAVVSANANPDPDVIELAPGGTYDFTDVYATYDGNTALPAVTSPITVHGNGATLRRVSASRVRLANVRLGDLTLEDATVRDFDIDTNFGGALEGNGSLTLRRCTFAGNGHAGINGGAVAVLVGTLVVDSCTFTANRGASGSAIIARPNEGPVHATIANSTFTGHVDTTAGVVFFFADVNQQTDGSVTNCTIAHNASFGGLFARAAANPGGADSGVATVTFRNTVFADNGSANVRAVNAAVTSLGGNVSSDTTGGGGPNDVRSVDPLVQPLADNGGPTQTCALALCSPAIDAASADAAPALDQRGFARVGAPDAGAFEFQTPRVSLPRVTSSPSGSARGCSSVTLTATATGEALPLTYTWFRANTPVGTGDTYVATTTSQYSVRVTDANGCTARSAVTNVTITAANLAVSPASLASGTVGAPYTATAAAGGGVAPYTFSVADGDLPPGLTLSSAGALSGTPLVPGTYTFRIAATDANGCAASRSYDLAVACQEISVSPDAIPPATEGEPYSATFAATGGTGATTFEATGALPPGMSLSSAGVLSGAPTRTGSFEITVTATDANGCTGTKTVTLAVDCRTVTVTPNAAPVAIAGSPYALRFAASGGLGALSFAASGQVPPGLALSADGLLSGTPTAGGTFAVGVTATDANGCAGSTTVSLHVDRLPVAVCSDVTVAAGPGCTAAASVDAGSYDPDGEKIGVTQSPAGPFPVGRTVVTVTARDGFGATSQCSAVVTVVDATAPTIACPANVSAVANATSGGVVSAVVSYPTPTASDECGGAAVRCTPASGSVFAEGTTTVTCAATDAAGNSASCAFVVTVAPPFGACYVDDATGDSISFVVDRSSPLYGYWRYTVAATGEALYGFAESMSYVPGRSLVASDRDDAWFRMDASFSYASDTGTAQARDLSTGASHTLRDRRLSNDPPCH